jgi:hypothetical protein
MGADMNDKQSIDVHCSCGRAFKVKRIAIGRTVKCPGCGVPNLIEEPEAASVANESNGFGAFDFDSIQPRSIEPIPLPREPQTSFEPIKPTAPYTPPKPTLPEPEKITSRLPASRRYRVLEFVAAFNYFMGILVMFVALTIVLISLVGVLITAYKTNDSAGALLGMWFAGAASTSFPAAMFGLFLFMQSELLKLAMDVQSNTLITAQAVTKSEAL